MTEGAAAPPASPAPARHPDGPRFGFPEAFGLSFATWLALLPRWLPVMLALSLPATVYAHWLTLQSGQAAVGRGWSAYRWFVLGTLGLVFGVLASAWMASAAVLKRRGEPPTFGASLRMSLPALPRALLLALLVVLIWSAFFMVAAGWLEPARGPEGSIPVALVGLGLFVVAGHRTLVWGVALAALLVEGGGVVRALQRSSALTAGRRLMLFFAWLLMVGLFYALDQVLARTVLAKPDLASSWTEHARAAHETWAVRQLWVQMVSDTLCSSLLAASIGVCYVGLRRCKEGAAGSELAEAFR